MADINCDMGEGIGNEGELMPFINSASIACGYHAGDMFTMQHTVGLCKKHNVNIGAHPSFLDRENFGRTEMNLSAGEIYELVTQQLFILNEVAFAADKKLHHVKPHGALYNMSARDPLIARSVANAVKDFDRNLILYGLSGSHSLAEAGHVGLKTASEVFADRRYNDNGSLVSRSEKDSLIDNAEVMIKQVEEMINEGMVTSVSGIRIKVLAETICIHGDGTHAVEFAKSLYNLNL